MSNSEKINIQSPETPKLNDSENTLDILLNSKDFEDMKTELDKANNFIEYFLIVGLDPSIALNSWLYEKDLEELNNEYSEQIKPKIISYFPPFKKHTTSFDDSIILHCFPNGFKLIESFTFPPSQQVFSFILDNNFYCMNFPQKYVTCLITYENIMKYHSIYYIDKVLDNEENEQDNQDNINQGNFLNNEKNVNIKNPNIYIPKCLLFISIYPFFNEYETIIQNLCLYSNRNNNNELNITIPIDKFIENLLIEIPYPPRGLFNIQYTLINKERDIKQNLMNELPVINLDLRLLTILNFDLIIEIYRYIILEIRILFFSKNIKLLNPFIYGFLALLFPFYYQYQIITILPKGNYEILESITPFIAGINETFTEEFFTEKDFTLSDIILIVDIDNQKIKWINDTEYTSKTLPELPRNDKKNLIKDVETIFSDFNKEKEKKKKEKDNKNYVSKNSIWTILESNNNNNIDEDNIDYEFNKKLNECFFRFNTKLLPNYSQYLNTEFYDSNSIPCLENLFKVDKYLSSIPTYDRRFYEKFITETQIFGDFLYKRMIPKNSDEILQILLFDEKINSSSSNNIFSNKSQNIFTDSKEYNFHNQYNVTKPRNLSEYEINFFKKKENKKKLLKYGIIINNQSDQIYFIYPIFPSLTTNLFFKETIKDYFYPINFNEEIIKINADIVSKSHLGGIEVHQTDMENYIGLCWIIIWAMTFWYCDSIERNNRFEELNNVLEKVSNHEMEIYNLLFEAINLYGDEKMIVQLYDFFITRHLNPSFKVHNIVMKILDNKESKGHKNYNIKAIIKELKEDKTTKKKIDKNKFRKRTFKSKYDSNILGEEVYFYHVDTCVECQKEINLESLSKNFKNMSRDIIWAKCPECKNAIIPKLTVQFGKEINKLGKLKLNTCSLDNFVLFSPLTLKSSYDVLINKYGIKLNVEEFKHDFPKIFWNTIWYFKIKNLPYDFILPYEYNIDTSILNKLNSHLKISTSDFEDENLNSQKRKFDNNKLQIEKI